jgi:hypothetical protein
MHGNPASVEKLCRFGLVLAAANIAACSSDLEIEFFYDDALIEAPTRTVSLHLFRSGNCNDVLSRNHKSGIHDPSFIQEYNYSYSMANHQISIEELAENEEILLEAEAYDRELTSIGRGCVVAKVHEIEKLRIQLYSLPRCETKPTSLDLTLVIDTSSTSFTHDPRGKHLEAIKTVFLEGQIFSRWTIISVGGPPEIRTSNNASSAQTQSIIDAMAEDYQALTTHTFDGITLAAKTIRAGAVCGRRSALFIYTANSDEGSALNLQNAAIGLSGSMFDKQDDIYTVGFSLDQGGFAELVNIIPENSGSFLLGTHPDFLEQQFYEVREEFQALIP